MKLTIKTLEGADAGSVGKAAVAVSQNEAVERDIGAGADIEEVRRIAAVDHDVGRGIAVSITFDEDSTVTSDACLFPKATVAPCTKPLP